jgi:hypothetical protein
MNKWYAIPPYMKREQWKIVNSYGELIAVFEDKSECEMVVKLINEYHEKTNYTAIY